MTLDLAAAAEDYRRDGAVVLRGLFDAELLAVLARGVDRNLAEPGPLCIATGEPGRGRFVEDFRNWDRIRSTRRSCGPRPSARWPPR